MHSDKDKPAGEDEDRHSGYSRLRSKLRLLYHSQSPKAQRFQFSVLVVDLAIIVFFIASPLLRENDSFLWIDYSIALLLAVDLTARALASTDIKRWLRQVPVILDVFILVTLLAPTWFFNLGFLRILRLWTMTRSSTFWRPLNRRGYAEYRETIQAVINLLVFLFVVTGFVYTAFANRGAEGIAGYVDALYFTVATVTTTGFGDITLPGTWGKLASISIMIVGISLFVKLAQSIFRPNKVHFPCPQCGLQNHDPDAVHCKACGHILNIPDPGNY
ncbi:ion channel [Devosia sp. J2-20]|jgi:voltage-gated potassium channel|uniref:ion channel n=1 Tax=Devosia TaxID=46913 RepID=UPI0022AFEA49|nr:MULTISPECIES: ion channel [Devosia]MCZ4346386.1 ion channel [Devosia neptuniae]WDQ98351.1 ion channel [Devosia sp. J2-20]|tara:strand:- start:52815 stop:53636 length:822 start_codon:yes stop_codon:yes gene_type:complete